MRRAAAWRAASRRPASRGRRRRVRWLRLDAVALLSRRRTSTHHVRRPRGPVLIPSAGSRFPSSARPPPRTRWRSGSGPDSTSWARTPPDSRAVPSLSRPERGRPRGHPAGLDAESGREERARRAGSRVRRPGHPTSRRGRASRGDAASTGARRRLDRRGPRPAAHRWRCPCRPSCRRRARSRRVARCRWCRRLDPTYLDPVGGGVEPVPAIDVRRRRWRQSAARGRARPRARPAPRAIGCASEPAPSTALDAGEGPVHRAFSCCRVDGAPGRATGRRRNGTRVMSSGSATTARSPASGTVSCRRCRVASQPQGPARRAPLPSRRRRDPGDHVVDRPRPGDQAPDPRLLGVP